MARELQTLALSERNQKFLDAESKIDKAIQIQQVQKTSNWRSMIGRSSYGLGEGMEKKAYRFFPGLSQQRGLQLWHPVQISRKPSAGDQGFDATKYNPHTVTYGFDSVTYGGLGIEYNTPNISIRDLRFVWQIKQQLSAVYGFLGDFTNDMWENYAREQYLSKCNDASNIFILGEGGPRSVTATYDPESVDTDGDNVLTIGSYKTKDIGILDWNYFKHHSRYLQMQAPKAAIGSRDGRPTYGWVGDLEDFDRMIEEDPKAREDWRHFNAQMLVDNYGNTTEYKGFNLMHDMLSPRFSIKKTSSEDVILKRVDAYADSAAALIGRRKDVSEDYLNAEFGMVIIFMKDVYQIEVPPSGPSSPGAGTNFGATPGLNGEWKWLNIQDAKDNPLNEIGFWFMRAEAFAKPLTWREEPIAILYRRFVHVTPQDTEIGGLDVAATQSVAADAVTADVDTTNNTATLALEGYLTAEAGQAVVVTDDDGVAIAGIVADSSAAPTYIFALDSTPSAFGKYTDAGGASVTVS